jgi:hypothetical protein
MFGPRQGSSRDGRLYGTASDLSASGVDIRARRSAREHTLHTYLPSARETKQICAREEVAGSRFTVFSPPSRHCRSGGFATQPSRSRRNVVVTPCEATDPSHRRGDHCFWPVASRHQPRGGAKRPLPAAWAGADARCPSPDPVLVGPETTRAVVACPAAPRMRSRSRGDRPYLRFAAP